MNKKSYYVKAEMTVVRTEGTTVEAYSEQEARQLAKSAIKSNNYIFGELRDFNVVEVRQQPCNSCGR